jgi:ketosteroid isomerase-like protein
MDSSVLPGDRASAPALLERIRKALQERDLDALAALYAEDATLEEVSSLNPPSHPAVARGREAILLRLRQEMLHDPISGWSRSLESATLVDGVETEEAVAFVELRTYAAGDKAQAVHMAKKHGGRIDRDRMVIAWDAD